MLKPIDKINYLSLDLELNTKKNDNEKDGYQTTEIIQVGASIGNIEDGIICTYSWFIDPKEPLSDHIIQLTGITEEDIKNSIPLNIIANELSELMNKYKCFVNPVQWGFDDADRLKLDLRKNNIYFPHFGRRVIDVKHLAMFTETARGLSVRGGLKSTMEKFKIKFKGKPHRADIDSENTLIFFFELLKRQRRMEDAIQAIKDLKI